MAFHLYNGNDLGAMAKTLAGMAFAGRGDPLAVETVVVPSVALGKWLSLEIAEACGFCPQIEFLRPGRFLYKYVFNPMLGRAGALDESAFTPDVTQWRIYEWLVTCRYERVHAFVQGDDLRRWQLARRMAQLFDQYMTTRQAMLARWEAFQPFSLSAFQPDESWQAELWRDLTKGRSDYFSALCWKAGVRGQESGVRKRKFYFFGIDTLPQCHVDVVMRLAQEAEVYFFMFNPCATLWDDVRSRKAEARACIEEPLSAFYQYECNPLLGNLGRLGRDFFVTMLDHDGFDAEAGTAFFNCPQGNVTLLQTIQGDIQENRRGERCAKQDASLRAHSCHGALREVEVLRDEVLRAFAEIPGLLPKDVRVYVADMATYAPYIEAVFGGTAEGRIPFAIADTSLAEEYAECRAFLRILEIALGRFGVTGFMEILAMDDVARQFGFSHEDTQVAGRLLAKSHVAWGIDGAHRASLGAGDNPLHTWEAALDRLVLGVAMEGGKAQRLKGVEAQRDMSSLSAYQPVSLSAYPCDSAEGQSQVVGKMAALFEGLLAVRHSFGDGTAQACGAWMERMREVARTFFGEPETEGARALFQAFADLEAQVEKSGGNPAMPFAVARQAVTEAMAAESRNADAVSGRMTFCRFTTLSGVPSRVVGMLGMNDGAFPAVAMSPGFDMQRYGRRLPGDVTPQDRDRYAFLQALLSARERLIVTVTGQSMRDNAALPPSSVVAELLAVTGNDVVVRHPLLPRGAASPRSKVEGGKVEGGQRIVEVSLQPSTFDLPTFIEFFKSPPAYYYKHVLGVRLKIDDDDTPEDDEPVGIDKLEAYHLKEMAVETLAEGGDAALRREWARRYASGELPVYAAAITEQVTAAAQDLRKKVDGAPKDAIILMRPADQKGKDIVTALLTLLAAVAEGTAHQVVTVCEDSVTAYAMQDAAMAQDTLNRLRHWFAEGQTRPLCFNADVCHEAGLLRPPSAPRNDEQSMGEALAAAWKGDDFVPGSGADEAARHCFGDTLNAENIREFLSISALFA